VNFSEERVRLDEYSWVQHIFLGHACWLKYSASLPRAKIRHILIIDNRLPMLETGCHKYGAEHRMRDAKY
jgi:hypothetical protein